MFKKNDDFSNKNVTESIDTTVIDIEDTTNIGMKSPDPASHSNIAQIPDTDEIERTEKHERKNFVGFFERKRLEKEKMENDFDLSQESVEQNSRSNKYERFNSSIEYGLSDKQVSQRIKEGLTNENKKTYSKTYKQIFFKNIFTFFNILCLGVAIALMIVEEYKNLSFMLILVCNTVIGIVQEIKAKKTIDRLSIVTAPTATVVRDGLTNEIKVEELVLDDIIKLKTGKQISADCVVVDGEIEVNESLLTGESIAVKKKVGDKLYAGSFITSGTCFAKVDRVGQDCYIQKLQARAKRYSKPKSELLRSLKTVTTFVTIVILPLGTIVAWKNYTAAQTTVPAAAFGTTGSLVVYGVNNGEEYEIGKITDMYNTDDDNPNTFSTIRFTTTESGNGNLIPSVSQIKLSYDNKVTGNVSVAGLKVTELVKNDDDVYVPGTVYEYDYRALVDSPLDAICSRYNGAKNNSRYSDGTIKLDDTGDYFVTKSFDNNKSFSTLSVEIQVQSRGYGFDETEEGVTEAQIAKQTITKTAGSLVGMIPTGLFLLVTIALAVSVVKLAKSKTLVQELYCIEMLARVDCICLDKTGTITDGTMTVKDIIDIAPINPKEPPIDIIMGAFLGAVEDNNMTSVALKKRFGENFEFTAVAKVPFSSARKYSAVTFEGKGTYILGAPEFVYQGKSKKINTIIAKKYAMGYRVLMLAKSDKPIVDGKAPVASCSPIILITIEDHIRDEAFDTIKWFKENGVQVKVISGDSPAAVAEIAGKVGIEGANEYVSLDGLSPQEVEQVAHDYTVFGRVSPDQKAILIRSLKAKGKTVAMTGDGVNDILAMKEADCSVAMANGSEAARNVAHLVLLDSNFSSMPKVVLEGRRVINNIQSSASLYLMKTIFVMVITFLSIVLSKVFYDGYPFEPIQFFLLELFIIGMPSTILALQPNKEQIKGNFLANIVLSCITQAFCLIITVLVIYLISIKGIEGLNLTTKDSAVVNSITVMALTYVGLIILVNICRPFNILRTVVCLISAAFITIAFSIPQIANTIGIAKMFKELSVTHKLFTIAVILAISPLERAFSDLIYLVKNKNKAPVRG